MKYFLLLLIIVAAICCVDKKEQPQEPELSAADKLRGQQMADSIIKAAKEQVSFERVDASKLKSCPIKVLSARIVKAEYGGKRNVQITYKNISNQRVEGVKFVWHAKNVFGESADMSGYAGGSTDEALSAGRQRTSTWEMFSDDAKTVVAAPFEVVLADGTKWK